MSTDGPDTGHRKGDAAPMTTGAGRIAQKPVARGTFDSIVQMLRRRRAVFAAVLVGAVLAAVVAVMLWTPPYEGRAVLQVQTAAAGSVQNLSFDLFYTDRLLNTYTELGESDQLHDELLSRLGVDGPLSLKTEVLANTELLVVEARAADPELAATAANTLATILADDVREHLGQRFDAVREALRLQIDEIDQRIQTLSESPGGEAETVGNLLVQRESLERSHNEALSLGVASVEGVSVVQEAEVPTDWAVSPVLLVALAGLLGVAGGFAAALVVDRLDRTVFDAGRAVQDRGHPLLGDVVPATAGQPAGWDSDAPLDPQALGVAFRLRQATPRSLLFTSAFDRPITPVAVARMTRALASTGLEVVAVDAASHPVLHTLLGTPDRPGLQEALRHGKPLAELALPTRHSHVHLVPGGSGDGTAKAAIEAFWVLEQLDSLTDAFDLVVVLAPPLLERAEASLLGRSVDGTVLVVEDAQLHEADLDDALEQVTALPGTFLGVVVAQPGRRGRRFSLRQRGVRVP